MATRYSSARVLRLAKHAVSCVYLHQARMLCVFSPRPHVFQRPSVALLARVAEIAPSYRVHGAS